MGTSRVVMAKRSVWPGLYREGQQWVQASGNRPRKQKKKKKKYCIWPNSQRGNICSSRCSSELAFQRGNRQDKHGQSPKDGWGWSGPSALRVEKPERDSSLSPKARLDLRALPCDPSLRGVAVRPREGRRLARIPSKLVAKLGPEQIPRLPPR